ncbi:MAG: hypothetical protein IOD12_08165 [Silvanigrellales bacterium]|jgi:hypothetical protein|nr:hypothetical protein [Silvanigrellales bacterium]
MNNGRQTILCLYKDPGTFDDRKSAASSPMLPIHSTLKLWGEAYVRLADEAALQVRLETCAAKREECLVVMEGVRRGALEHISTLSVKPRVIVVTSETMKHDPEDLVATREVHHFLSVAQGHLATTALISAVKKWTTRDIFGIEKYLTYGTPVNFFAVNRSNERSWFVDTLLEFVSGLEGIIPNGAADFARMAGEVLDELLMNAIWDANPARAGSERDKPVLLKPSETVRVEWGVDGNLLAVSVTDPFGSFKRDDLQTYRHEVLNVPREASVRVNTQGPGAGIGLHMVIRRVSGLVINMNAGVSTECIALFDVTRSPRWLNNGPKTFHFFSV